LVTAPRLAAEELADALGGLAGVASSGESSGNRIGGRAGQRVFEEVAGARPAVERDGIRRQLGDAALGDRPADFILDIR